MTTIRYWTYPQIRRLLAMLPTHPYAEIGAALNRTPRAVRNMVAKLRAEGMDVPDPRKRRGPKSTWTAEQLGEFLTMQATHSYAEMAAATGRTAMALMRKASKLRGEGYAIPDARARNGELAKARWAAAVLP